jgi:biotin transport system substrate-specific component
MSNMQQMSVKEQDLNPLSPSRESSKIVGRVVVATGLVALCAHVSVPLGFTPVPVTMQPFAVMLLGLVFGPVAAFSSLALYLLEGALGLPVFSPHGLGGMAQLLGPTGGYLLSYPFAAALASVVYRRWGRSAWSAIGGATMANVVMLAMGSVWLATLTHTHLSAVLAQSVLPFLPGDALKIAAAAACARVFASFGKDLRQRTI